MKFSIHFWGCARPNCWWMLGRNRALLVHKKSWLKLWKLKCMGFRSPTGNTVVEKNMLERLLFGIEWDRRCSRVSNDIGSAAKGPRWRNSAFPCAVGSSESRGCIVKMYQNDKIWWPERRIKISNFFYGSRDRMGCKVGHLRRTICCWIPGPFNHALPKCHCPARECPGCDAKGWVTCSYVSFFPG